MSARNTQAKIKELRDMLELCLNVMVDIEIDIEVQLDATEKEDLLDVKVDIQESIDKLVSALAVYEATFKI